ncbi:hypothetical protein AB0C69_03490 [Actinomadura sp. NPDC048032]|uniref:hypothetical protein n=1 Tax=Actinomadura sp. NPDC048032 TaxID=3155747 RepID=UPI00340564F0
MRNLENRERGRALALVLTICGFVPRRVRLAREWLTNEVTGPAKRRRPAIAWTVAVVAMVVGTGNNVLLLKSGATGMPAFVTAFLTDVAACTALWLVVRPKWRQVDRRVKRSALIFGCTSPVSIWSGQEALHHMPYAMVAVLALMVGPMVAALVSGRKNWQIVGWVLVSGTGATLLYGMAAWQLSPIGILSVVLNGMMYWAMARIFTGLGRLEEEFANEAERAVNAAKQAALAATTPREAELAAIAVKEAELKAGSRKEAVLTASALKGLVSVPVLFVLFLSAHGPTVVSQHSAWATIGALGVGTLATISALCSSAAWKRGLTISAHAQLQPAKPLLGLFWGTLVAGQKPPKFTQDTIAGYLLVCLGALAVGLIFVEEKTKEQIRKARAKKARALGEPDTA